MFPSVEEAEPFEPDVDVVFSELGFLDFFEWDFGEIFDSVVHEELHWLLFDLDLLLWVNALSELLLEHEESILLLHSRLQPQGIDFGRHGRWRRRRLRRGGVESSGLEPVAGAWK